MSAEINKLDSIIRKAIWKSGLHRYQDIEDAVNEIWIKALAKWPSGFDQVPLSVFFWFAYRRAQDIKRVMGCTAEMAVDPSNLSETIANLGDAPEPTAETYLIAKEILGVLSLRERAIIYALHAEGRSQLSVAQEHHISRSRVEQIDKSALAKIRSERERSAPPSSRRPSTCSPSSPPPSSPPSSRF